MPHDVIRSPESVTPAMAQTMTEYEYAEGGLYSYDRKEIIDEISELMQADPETHGFVRRAEVESRYSDENIKYSRQQSEIVTAIGYRHNTNKNYTTVYHLAAKDGYPETREPLLRRVLLESPHNQLRTKVPVGVSQNDFWKEHGEHITIKAGKRRQLNVYRVEGSTDTEDSKSLLRYTQ